MPEMPEVQGLVDFLDGRLTGLTITRVIGREHRGAEDLRPAGRCAEGRRDHRRRAARQVHRPVARRPAPHLIFHLAKAGWLRWYDKLPATSSAPARRRSRFASRSSDGSGFDLTEAGTKKSLAVYVVREPADVPGVARLGPDPLDPAFTRDTLAGPARRPRARRSRACCATRSIIAGVGNAYSDEILHAAQDLAVCARRDASTDAEIDTLFAAMTSTLTEAVAEASGKPPAELKDAKRRGMRVHGRRGEICPVCGDTVRERLLRRQLARVLPDVPDRRQDPRRPPPVATAQVARVRRVSSRGDLR